MDVLFVEPPGRYLRIMGSLGKHKADFLWQPFDHLVMAGYLRKEIPEIEFKIIDARDEDFKYVKKMVRRYKPAVVVFNTCVTSIDNDLKIVDTVREVNEDIVTIATGQVLKALGIYAMKKSKDLDFAIIDPEPEYALIQLLKTNFNPKTGVCYRDGDFIKKITKLPYSNKIDVNELGIPAHDMVDNTKYYDIFQRRKNFALVYGSRGCRYGLCSFCSCPRNYQPMRLRNINTIIEELKWLVNDFDVHDIKWWDAEINQDLEWCKNLFSRITEEEIDIVWQANLRADLVPMWLLKLMKKAGCYHVSIGLESANLTILKNVRKGITPDMIERTVRKLKNVGIDFMLYSLVGLPGETKETIEETRKFIYNLGCPATFGIAVPNPGTEFYDWIVSNGYLRTNDYSKFDTGKPPVYDYLSISSEEMYEESKKGYRMFLTPKYVVKTLFNIRSFRQLKTVLKTGIKIIRGD